MELAAKLADDSDGRVSSLISIVEMLKNLEKCGDISDDDFRIAFAGARTMLELDDIAMARLLGISRPTIWRWEKGESAPYPPMRPKVLKALQKEALGKVRLHKRAVS